MGCLSVVYRIVYGILARSERISDERLSKIAPSFMARYRRNR